MVAAHIGIGWVKAIRAGQSAARRNTRSPRLIEPVEWPRVSVLIPAWCEVDTVERCLTSLNAVNYPDWEVIVIAGGPDGTFEQVQSFARPGTRYPLVVLEQQPKGKNAALNQGLAVANGTVVVVLDADSNVSSGWLKSLVQPLLCGSAAACGNYLPMRETWVSRHEQMEKTSLYVIHQRVILQGSGSIAIGRHTLEMVGGFPETVRVGVDWDLDVRISQRGLPKAFAVQAEIRTQRPSTLGEYWRNEIRWRRAHLRSLWMQRRWFLSSPRAIFASLVFYIVALIPLITAAGILGALAVQRFRLALFLVALLALFVVWVVGRRAALTAEIASYTAHPSGLKAAWVPGTLLLVSIAASWLAMLTYGKQAVQFKGPRP